MSAGAQLRTSPGGRSLEGRHAAVTGAGSGIGAAIGSALSASGARVSLMGRRIEPLVARRDEIRACAGGEAGEVPLDVTRPEEIGPAFAAAAARFGPVDILVNCAGAAESAPFLKTDPALLERMLAVNFTGAFHCAQAVLPAMLERKAGRIVNIASTAGVTGYAYVAAYCAAKHALVGLTRALARELARSGVTVNAVCPGFTDTDLVARSVATIAAKTGRTPEQAREELARTNPMGRLVTPEEIASAVAWLCLPSAASVTGQAIVIAGGEIMP